MVQSFLIGILIQVSENYSDLSKCRPINYNYRHFIPIKGTTCSGNKRLRE